MKKTRCCSRIRSGEAVDHFETVRRKKDGSEVNISVTISPVRDRAGTIIGASKVARDITEQKRAEEALRESESRLSVAMAAGQMGSWEWRMADNTVSWSKALEAIHGLEPGTFAGSFEAFLADVHPEDRQNVQDTISNSIETGTHEIEYRIIPPNGQERWVLGRGQLIRDGRGTPTRMVGVCMDITERKLAEQKIAEVSAQKDEFLGIVSHELRTPITTILGNASLLNRRLDTLSAGDREAALADLAADAERMERIINNLLVLARVDSPVETELEPVLLPRVVQKVVEQKRRRLHREIVLTIENDVPEVIGHAQYIDHILSNLLVNANKYSPKSEAVEVQGTQRWRRGDCQRFGQRGGHRRRGTRQRVYGILPIGTGVLDSAGRRRWPRRLQKAGRGAARAHLGERTGGRRQRVRVCVAASTPTETR